MARKKGISLVDIKDSKTVEQILTNFPDSWFELSYLSTKELLKEQLPIISGRISSIHLLCPVRDFFPNIASKKAYKWSEEQILKDAEFGAKIGAEVLVLHPGYVIDGLLSIDNEKRMKQLSEADLKTFMLNSNSTICKPEYLESEQYLKSFSLMAENAIKLTEKVKSFGVKLAIENLNPRVSYLVIHPDEVIYLASLGLNINLDVGHLQVSSALLGLDFYNELERIIKTGKVVSMHLHSNESCNGIYKDSHCSFDKYMDYKKVLSIAQNCNTNLILETTEEPLHNVSLLFEK